LMRIFSLNKDLMDATVRRESLNWERTTRARTMAYPTG
jgi:hypothetical protein